MRTRFFIASVFYFWCLPGISQLKQIDFNAIAHWKSLGNYGISPDGAFVWYEIVSEADAPTLVLCDSKGKQRRTYLARDGKFSGDSKWFIMSSGNGIRTVNLKTGKEMVVEKARDARVVSVLGKQLIFYNTEGNVTTYDLNNQTKQDYGEWSSYYISDEIPILYLKNDTSVTSVDLSSNKRKCIYQGQKIHVTSFFNETARLLFTCGRDNEYSIYKFDPGYDSVKLLVANSSIGLLQGYFIDGGRFFFSKDGRIVYFYARKKAEAITPDTSVLAKDLNVWNYKDKFVQPSQRFAATTFACAVPFEGGLLTQIESEETKMESFAGNHFVITKNVTNEMEYYWDTSANPQYSLLSIGSGKSSKFIPSGHKPFAVTLSPDGKFITWTDTVSHNLFCYEISSQKITDLSDILGKLDQVGKSELKIEGWLKLDSSIVLLDSFDIWQVNLLSEPSAIAITNGVGRKNKIKYRSAIDLLEFHPGLHEQLLLAYLVDSSKSSGFSIVDLSKVNKPKNRFTGPFIYCFQDEITDIRRPIQAKSAKKYLIQRQNGSEDINLCILDNLKSIIVLSDIDYSKGFKWFNVKRVNWISDGGTKESGLIYIPTEIDTTKKYPMIVNYYMKRSNEFLEFKRPYIGSVNVNVPWYTSRDYIVFIPDIQEERGHTGRRALMSIESGVHFLTETYPWIDSLKMGLQGQSFGGYLTNYVATHSHLFAAAQSSAGPSDLISKFGSLAFGERSDQNIHEVGQLNIGTTPWQRPDLYIENSAIFTIDKVTTPLLLMHGRKDNAVKFSQAVELFMNLRRVQKPVWLLDYDCGHVLEEDDNGRDFVIRQTQFFDHYLKGKPAPAWMTKSLPAKYKGIRSGLALDPIGKCSNICPICNPGLAKKQTVTEASLTN